ncbi:MAG: biosynthetic-type acetolactate synthase large subunit [Candidatus Melainabacteria bacterium]|nr:biosynthetic-type acetolactate synthase large subunit [Candidatus Melainabacteria bacterium]
MATTPARTNVALAAVTAPQQATQPQTISGAHIFLKALQAAGVDTVFGLPGGVILPIYDALVEYPIQHILVRHEQGAVHMAEGYARATGKAGVALVTSGPGATNIVTGVADAYYDSVPLVVFTGNVPTTLLGNDAFQEADIMGITRPCTKHNIIVRRVEDLASAIQEAFYVATTGRPGPVVVDIPKDVILAKTQVDWANISLDLPGYQPVETAHTPQDIEAALRLLEQAERPMMLVGGGVVNGGAHQEALALAERLNIPVGCSLMGLGGFPANHPLYLGFTGMHGQYWANLAVAHADVLIVAGNRLGDRQTGNAKRFARHAKIIHIDLDPSTLQKNVDAFLPIQGDVRRVLQDVLSQSEDLSRFEASLKTRAQWFEQIETWKARRQPKPASQSHLTAEFAIERLFHHLPHDAFVTTEVGQHQMWAAQRYNLSRPRSFISSGGLGTMGFGFPAAIGIQAAFPDKTVVDIAGDGSFQMCLQELATACDYGLPVKVAIINNGHLGMIRQWQGSMYGRLSSAQLSSPDYCKLAEAYGAVGLVVEHPEQVDAVIAQALAITDRPVLIDFRVVSQADVYPWVPAGAANEDMLTEPQQKTETAS